MSDTVPDPPIAEHLLQLETALQRQEVRADAAQLDRLIADDFFEFGVSGQCWTKSAIIAALREESFSERRLDDFRVTSLAADVMLATYRAERLSTSQRIGARSLRSSIWRRRNGLWQMMFHQGTPL